jgi:hypothetical protein
MSFKVDKHLMRFVCGIILISTVFAVSCCTLRWKQDQSKRAAGDTNNRDAIYKEITNGSDVRADLQLGALQQADAKNAVSVLGLFSEAGYVDGGQTVIFEMEDGSAQLQRTEPGAKQPGEARSISPDRFKALMSSLSEFRNIGNYNKASFDGVRFEFIHCRRNDKDSPLKLEQRSLIMTLQDDAEAEPFRKFLGIFDDLNKSK